MIIITTPFVNYIKYERIIVKLSEPYKEDPKIKLSDIMKLKHYVYRNEGKSLSDI